MIRAAKFQLLFAVTAVLLLCPRADAQGSGRATATIRERIDESRLVTLHNNTRPEATAENDRGPVADDFALDHMLLQLKRSPEREAALEQYIAQLNQRSSPNYHKLLTPDRFAEDFGVAQEDVRAVTGWLESQGFKVNGVQKNGLVIDYSGTARQVRDAYRTEIHNLMVNGRMHFANMSDPQIPAALAPAVEGVISLHNFHPKAYHHARGNYTYTTSNGTFHALAAGD